MSRHHAREEALALLYQLAIRPEGVDRQRTLFVREHPLAEEDDAEYFNRLVEGVLKNKSEIETIISRYLRGWTIDRQETIDVAILSIAVFELLFDTEIPTEIAISEAVILADLYGTDKSRPFVNAVLGNIDRNESRRAASPEESPVHRNGEGS